MTGAEELEWHRDWRKRLLSALRLWWKPASYADACASWTRVSQILAERPPTDADTGDMGGRDVA